MIRMMMKISVLYMRACARALIVGIFKLKYRKA
jgi:hypothetical protein